MNKKQAGRIFSSIFLGHPLPIGTRVKCRDKRFVGGYFIATIRGYSQGWRVIGDKSDLNLRRPYSYGLNYAWNRIYKSPETVMEILE